MKTEEWFKTVTITEKEYAELERASHILSCLEAAGVDNWDGYDFAMEQYKKETA